MHNVIVCGISLWYAYYIFVGHLYHALNLNACQGELMTEEKYSICLFDLVLPSPKRAQSNLQ